MAEPVRLPRVVVVTGTSTGVGKTIATAALAATLLARDLRVAVAKPAQTGVIGDEPGDLQEVCRLAAPLDLTASVDLAASLELAAPDKLARSGRLTGWEGVRLRDPLAPAAAARTEGRTVPTVLDHAVSVAGLALDHDVVLVEGAGGLLVELDAAGGTLADLATALQRRGIDVGVVVVAAPALGTLNHTALTVEALRARTLPIVGVVVGSWPQPPEEPDLAMRENLADLPRIAGVPLIGTLPAGAGALTPEEFCAAAPGWLAAVQFSG